jgi:hypothetical protein
MRIVNSRLLKEPIDHSPLNLISTPIAIMRKQGLRTYAGISGDDPSNTRHADASFLVVLSIYGESRLLGRVIIDSVSAHEHYFIDIDHEVSRYGWDEIATLCVVHRVPSQYIHNYSLINNAISLTHTDFSTYRIVVQYGIESKGMGSVIYETPPNFNTVGRKPHFLSFSNMIYLNSNTENYLTFINYSISPNYQQPANVKILFRDKDGNHIGQHQTLIPAFNFKCLEVHKIIKPTPSKFISFTAATVDSALIPLSIIANRNSGSLSVEHSHPPQEYVMAQWPIINEIRLGAARSTFADK